jgi:hypothetical protein
VVQREIALLDKLSQSDRASKTVEPILNEELDARPSHPVADNLLPGLVWLPKRLARVFPGNNGRSSEVVLAASRLDEQFDQTIELN